MSIEKSASNGVGWAGPARVSGKTATGRSTHCGQARAEASQGVVAHVGPADAAAAGEQGGELLKGGGASKSAPIAWQTAANA